jgi:hypothetical protein
MTPTIDRLTELLDLKDRQLEEQHEQIATMERQVRDGVDWMLHHRRTPEEETLPVPRLELRIVDNWEHAVESEVCLVVAERDSRISAIPMGYSKRSGAGLRINAYPTAGELPEGHIRELPRVLDDLCFYSEKTALPAFVVLDETHRYRVTSLRPLRMEAVSSI